ncbi:8-oxo-dGTP diphosphatase MutT [Enterobacillus tribolii]|uniref:8-oxo-dGTP diphosphatase n=1 Tax=Enterobacillus tribolii TaxID=1487935 RepID=A0A370R1S0_9GAMM|nr:8-oxo-dGTP diphosphatase MutT [Enterobacillus tribolii]MBW7983037.1 8-oxo-dGTP diphosphatase MutT [Enterobacillus tribolii]RDK95859.1 8-oxo-dGTPase [Enterobacillus tribolii]
MTRKHLHIAVGIIRNEKGEVFITRRVGDSHLAGLWEFPGGKIEAGESPEQGLRRELMEETGIQVQQSELLCSLDHHFDDRTVTLYFYLVEHWQGTPFGREGQPERWVHQHALNAGEFPEPNKPVIELLNNA